VSDGVRLLRDATRRAATYAIAASPIAITVSHIQFAR
jgi:hypothetical protein